VLSKARLARLARPPARWTPADRVKVASVLEGTPADSDTRRLLDLLREWLDYRFGADVGIGRHAPAIGEDEISIAWEDGG
jgi:hypothetical protein